MKMHLVLHVSGKNTSNQNSSTIQHWLEREKKKKNSGMRKIVEGALILTMTVGHIQS